MEAWIMRMPDEKTAIHSCMERFGSDGSGFNAASDLELAAADRALYDNEISGPAMAAADTEAFRQGVVGYAQDIYVQGQPWTFEPGAINVPAHIVHGGLDEIVPLEHSRYTAGLIATSTLRVLEGYGHLSTLAELPAVSAELIAST
jgi:pimeloyl-ACP methyl ester carboxylesterase